MHVLASSLAFACALASALSACAPSPPPHWAEGGAPLTLVRARWQRGSSTVDLLEDGRVLVDGESRFHVDRSGRVENADLDPMAVLTPDGRLIGDRDRSLGQIGVNNASAPGSDAAWLRVAPDGAVTRFDNDGDRHDEGIWKGCEGAALRTCTLVTHLVVLREVASRPHFGFGVGVGAGGFVR